jgi:hypothetical protein
MKVSGVIYAVAQPQNKIRLHLIALVLHMCQIYFDEARISLKYFTSQ